MDNLKLETVTTVLGLGAQFRLGTMGHERLVNALTKLSSYESFGSLVAFGLGQRRFLKTVTKTKNGLQLAALLAALASGFELHDSPIVLRHLLTANKITSDQMPDEHQLAKAHRCMRRTSGSYTARRHDHKTRSTL